MLMTLWEVFPPGRRIFVSSLNCVGNCRGTGENYGRLTQGNFGMPFGDSVYLYYPPSKRKGN